MIDVKSDFTNIQIRENTTEKERINWVIYVPLIGGSSMDANMDFGFGSDRTSSD